MSFPRAIISSIIITTSCILYCLLTNYYTVFTHLIIPWIIMGIIIGQLSVYVQSEELVLFSILLSLFVYGIILCVFRRKGLISTIDIMYLTSISIFSTTLSGILTQTLADRHKF